MIIAQISDTHIAHDVADKDQRIEEFRRTIADINTLDPQPDLIVHTGDITHNGLDGEYADARAVLDEAKSPVFVLAGNKDNRANLKKAFADQEYIDVSTEFVEYEINDYPLKLVIIDTVSENSNKGAFCKARVESFTRLTMNEHDKPIVVFAHHPPFEALQCPDPFQFETSESMQHLRTALSGVERLAAVFCGHVHRFDSGEVAGLLGTALPSIATELRKGVYPEWMRVRPVYQVHRFNPEVGFITETRIVDDL
ncbi:MAG: metallophosphoesterase [Hyphomicrobiales bacterium]